MLTLQTYEFIFYAREHVISGKGACLVIVLRLWKCSVSRCLVVN